MISPISFSNSNNNQFRNNQKINYNYQNYNNLNQPASDCVSFSGAAKVLADIGDRAFVDVVSKCLKLNEEGTTKLKNTVWRFLRENKVNSLGELGGEEHFDQQVELQGRITKVLSISEDNDEANEYLADEIIRRCDDGKDYIPLGLEGFAKGSKFLENLFWGKQNISLKEGMEKLYSNTEDDHFYQFAKKMLRQTPEESYEFRKTIEKYLEENNYKSIKELFSDEDSINDQACLIEKLEKEFNLSETESSALHFSFLDRAYIDVMSESFTTNVSLYVKDYDSIAKVVQDCGLEEYRIGDWSLNQTLYRLMCADAKEKELDNVFELFKPENNFNQSRTYKFIKEESGLSEEQQADLILDFAKVAKNPEAFAEDIPKSQAKDNFYANIQTMMITEKIAKTFGIENSESEIFENVISKKMQESVRKIFPKHVEGGQNGNIKQVAFEIADEYGLPSGAEKTIEDIITNVQQGGTKSADIFLFEKLTSDCD